MENIVTEAPTTKTLSLKAPADVAQKFKDLAVENDFGSQGEFLASMINAFEMANAGKQIPGRAKETETVQGAMNIISAAFNNSWYVNEIAEERIRETLALELTTKDQTIADLQAYKLNVKKQLEDSAAQSKLDLEKVATLEKNIEDAEKQLSKKTIEANERQSQIKTLADQLTYQSDDLIHFKAENAELSAKNKVCETAIAIHHDVVQDLKNEIVKLKTEIESASEQKEFYKMQVQKLDEDAKALINEHKNEIADLKADAKAEKAEKDNAMNALRDEQKVAILSLKAEIKAEKEDAVTNAVKLKNAEFELIKLSLNNALTVKDEQIAILQAKLDGHQKIS